MNDRLKELHKIADEISLQKEELRRKILSNFSKEIFGYPPGKKGNKTTPGRPVNHHYLQKIYSHLY